MKGSNPDSTLHEQEKKNNRPFPLQFPATRANHLILLKERLPSPLLQGQTPWKRPTTHILPFQSGRCTLESVQSQSELIRCQFESLRFKSKMA